MIKIESTMSRIVNPYKIIPTMKIPWIMIIILKIEKGKTEEI